jgi:hypothetical protein
LPRKPKSNTVRAEGAARLGGDVQATGVGAGDLVEMQVGGAGEGVGIDLLFDVGGIHDWPLDPAVAAVGRGEKEAVGADGKAVLGVPKPDVEQRTLLLRRPVEPFPVGAAVAGAENHRVVADHPAQLLVVQVDAGQGGPGGHLDLVPGCALVAAHQHVAALAHGHHHAAGGGTVEQQRARGERLEQGDFGLFVLWRAEDRRRQDGADEQGQPGQSEVGRPGDRPARKNRQRTPARRRAAGV